MNRTDTAPRILAYLAEEHTVKKLLRRVDELGYVRWLARRSDSR